MQFGFRGNHDIFNQLVGRYKDSFCKAKKRLQETGRKQGDRSSCGRDTASPWLRGDVNKLCLRNSKGLGTQLSDSGPNSGLNS